MGSTWEGEHEKARTSQGQVVEEARRPLEEERYKNAGLLATEQNRLMEKERNSGVLEGQVIALTAGATSLRERVNEMSVRQREAEVQTGRHRQGSDRIFTEMSKARDQVKTAQNKTEEAERAAPIARAASGHGTPAAPKQVQDWLRSELQKETQVWRRRCTQMRVGKYSGQGAGVLEMSITK